MPDISKMNILSDTKSRQSHRQNVNTTQNWLNAVNVAQLKNVKESNSPKLSLSPFETGEHMEAVEQKSSQLSNIPAYVVHGIKLSDGIMTALPDFVTDPNELEKMSPALFRKLIQTVEQEAKTPGFIDSDKADKEIKEIYAQAALRNTPHFAPSDAKAPQAQLNEKHNHWANYLKFHDMALNWAGAGEPKTRLYENYALHFLTDAFASGHKFSKMEIMQSVQDQIKNTDLRDKFISKVANELWTKPKVRQAFKDYTVKYLPKKYYNINFDKVESADHLKKILNITVNEDPSVLPNFIVKMVHDKLNASGVEVTNGIAKWQAYGDGSLQKSPETKMFLGQAIGRSYAELQKSWDQPYNEVQKIAGQKNSDRSVWSLVPSPTSKGQAAIDAAIKDYGDLKSEFAGPELANLLNEYIGEYVQKLAAKGLIS